MVTLPDVQTGNEEFLYNIGVVSRMTGITMATLRAWERRYNFPESRRTSGGHRLYSEKDILRLRWVKSRIDDGMQTAQAITALRHQEQTGHMVLVDQQLIHHDQSEANKAHLQVVQDRLIDSLLRPNLQGADEIIGEVLGFASPEDLILEVIAPVLKKIGEGWEKGEVDVAAEHLATNYLRQRLMMWMLSGPPPQARQPIVLACAPDEWHEGSLLILGSLLRRRRWPVAYLGQSLPFEYMGKMIKEINPSLIVMVAMTEKSAENLVFWPKLLPELANAGKPIIGYGGRIFVEKPEWRLKIQGIYLGNTLQEGITTIERLLINRS